MTGVNGDITAAVLGEAADAVREPLLAAAQQQTGASAASLGKNKSAIDKLAGRGKNPGGPTPADFGKKSSKPLKSKGGVLKSLLSGDFATQSASVIGQGAIVFVAVIGTLHGLTHFNPFNIVVNAYMIFFAFTCLIVEGSTMLSCGKSNSAIAVDDSSNGHTDSEAGEVSDGIHTLTYAERMEHARGQKGFKGNILRWMPILGRMSGRAFVYIYMGSIAASEGNLKSGFRIIVLLIGIYETILGISFLIIAVMTTRKLKAVRLRHAAELGPLFEKYADVEGFLTSKEFKALCEELGVSLSPPQLSAAMSVIDINGDSRISRVEFKAWWSGEILKGSMLV